MAWFIDNIDGRRGNPGVHRSAGKSPAFFLNTQSEKRRLICYWDESVDFGPYSKHSPGYCFSFVFVTPQSDYLQEEEKYQRRISRLTGVDHFVYKMDENRKKNWQRFTIQSFKRSLKFDLFPVARTMEAIIKNPYVQDMDYDRYADSFYIVSKTEEFELLLASSE